MGHKPVMLDEVLQQLAIKPEGIYLDGTFGRGGHSQAILGHLGAAGRLLALDRDHAAIASAQASEMRRDLRFSLYHASFDRLLAIARPAQVLEKVDGLLLDLGVSSPQLDCPERGFSFLRDGPLDMRMDITVGQSASSWLMSVGEQDLVRVLYDFGEERYARRIARAIATARADAPIATTKQLADLIAAAVPVFDKHKHPATRSFQAIRIAVNQELAQLQAVLPQALSVLKPGGRLVVMAFHSLEDRVVKRFINDEAGAKHDPGKLPVKQADIPKGALKKVGKAIKPGAAEMAANPRARSAVMRVAEKV